MAEVGEMHENPPAACPAGHPWPFPRPRGQAAAFLTGTQPCGCTAVGNRSHRSYTCEFPGRGEVILRPACARDGIERAIHT